MMLNKNKIIGITGGSGVGKSKICSILSENHNSVIIDADIIAHNIIKNDKPAFRELVEYFGNEIIGQNKEIDRKKLGSIAFKYKEKLEFLTKTTHKYIIKEMKYQTNKYKNSSYSYIVLDAPLLIEANLHKDVNFVWVVHSSLETRIKRLQKRDNLTRELILERINRQTPFEITKTFADLIIQNEDDINLEQIIANALAEI